MIICLLGFDPSKYEKTQEDDDDSSSNSKETALNEDDIK